MSEQPIAFGPFVFDPRRASLTREGKSVAIGGRAAALLEALLEANGEPVTKASLMEQAWPGAVVEEGNLTVQIAALRKALGTTPSGLEWIATVPRLGYRLVRDGPTGVAEPARPPLLAVLPFQNLSADPEQDYFADGIVEDITTALSRFKSFAVIARSSSFVYKRKVIDTRKVGEELGVRYVLEGSVRRSVDRVRVTAQLVEVQLGAQLWARRFEGPIEDVFDMQDHITESVAGVLEPEIRLAEIELSRRERPNSIAAYDLYLRGLSIFNSQTPEDLAAAAALFDQAVELEPSNAVYTMSSALTAQWGRAMGWPDALARDGSRVPQLCHAAAGLAPTDGAVLARCALILAHVTEGREAAVPMAARAVELNPNSPIVMYCAGLTLLHLGDLDQALAYLYRALELSPNDPEGYMTMTGIAHVMMAKGQFDDAVAWAERSLVLNRYWNSTYWMLIAGHALAGRMEAAQRYFDMFGAVSRGATIRGIREGQPDKLPDRNAAIYEGLRSAGLPEA